MRNVTRLSYSRVYNHAPYPRLRPPWIADNERIPVIRTNGLGKTKNMSTRRQLVAVPGEPRPTSTKHEPTVTVVVEGDRRMTRRRSSAWDPYEVWRTRVKGEQTPMDDAEANPAA